jgi:hypothetical protein
VDVDAVLAALFALISPHLTEKQRRLGSFRIACGKVAPSWLSSGAASGKAWHLLAGVVPGSPSTGNGLDG